MSGEVTRTPDLVLSDTENISNAKLNRVGGGTFKVKAGSITDTELSPAASISGGFDTVSALRANTGSFDNNDRVSVKGYYTATDGAFGPDLIVDTSDTTTADDGFSCFVDTNGLRFKRTFTDPVNILWAGCKGDYDENDTQDDNTDDTYTDNSTELQTIINYLILQDGGSIYVPPGRYGVDTAIQIYYRHHKDSNSGGYRRFAGIKIEGAKSTNDDSIFEGLSGCAFVATKTNTTGILDLKSVSNIYVGELSLINKADAAPQLVNVDSYKRGEPGGDYITDAAITASDNTLTSATNPWTSADVGNTIRVDGAGAAGANLTTTIASYTSAGSVELTAAASTTVSGAICYWPDPAPTSSIHISFNEVIFIDDEAVTNAVVDLQSCKIISFSRCKWITGSDAVIIGEDTIGGETTLMDGDVNLLVFRECAFAGDIQYKQARNVTFDSCEWWAVKNGSGTGAAIVPAGDEKLRGVTFRDCKAAYDADGTGTFFELGDNSTNLNVRGGLFGEYNRIFKFDSDIFSQSRIYGCIFRNTGSGDRDIEIASGHVGKVDISADHKTTTDANRIAVSDARSTQNLAIRYNVAFHKERTADYTLTGAGGYETILKGATRLRGGLYRLTWGAYVVSNHNSIYRARLKNYQMTTAADYIASGEVGYLTWTGIIRLSSSTATSQSSVTGTVTSSGTALTGTGTAFLTDLSAGDWIRSSANDWAEIASVTNDTAAVLTASTTASGQGFFYGDITDDTITAFDPSTNAPNIIELEMEQISAGGTSTVNHYDATAGGTFILLEEL